MTGNVARGVIVVFLFGSATIAIAQIATVQPGQWEMISTVRSVEMPSAPPQVAKAMIGRTTTVRHCITPQEAANGGRELMKNHPSCKFNRYVLAGGKFDAEMTCRQAGSTVTSTMAGSYTATTINSIGHTKIEGPAPMTITTSLVEKRVGGC